MLHDGVGSLDVDILAASAAVAAFNTAVSWERLLYEERAPGSGCTCGSPRSTPWWPSPSRATVLVVFVLLFFPDEHASLADAVTR